MRRAGLDVIFNFSRYEELRQAVMQLVRENLDPELLHEEAHDLFESWWASTHSQGQWNAEVNNAPGIRSGGNSATAPSANRNDARESRNPARPPQQADDAEWHNQAL